MYSITPVFPRKRQYRAVCLSPFAVKLHEGRFLPINLFSHFAFAVTMHRKEPIKSCVLSRLTGLHHGPISLKRFGLFRHLVSLSGTTLRLFTSGIGLIPVEPRSNIYVQLCTAIARNSAFAAQLQVGCERVHSIQVLYDLQLHYLTEDPFCVTDFKQNRLVKLMCLYFVQLLGWASLFLRMYHRSSGDQRRHLLFHGNRSFLLEK